MAVNVTERANVAQPFQQAGAGAVLTTVTQQLLPIVRLSQFDTPQHCFDYLSANGGTLILDGVVDLGAGTINISGSNWRVIAGAGAAKFTTTAADVFNVVGALNNVAFYDVTLESTGSGSGYGLFSSLHQTIAGLQFIRTKFAALNADTNAIKIVVENSSSTLNGLTIDSCTFSGIGRMGVELQNHLFDGVTRFSNVFITRSLFSNLGTISAYGMGISTSGKGENVSVTGNIFAQCKDIACEIAGGINGLTVTGNTMANQKAGCNPLSIANNSTDYTTAATITGNVMTGTSGVVVLYGIVGGTFSGNTVRYATAGGNINARNIQDMLIANNNLKTAAGLVIYVETNGGGVSTRNVIVGNVLDNNGISNSSVVRFYGTGATLNVVRSNFMRKGTGGVYFDQQSGAASNYNVDNTYEGLPYNREWLTTAMSDANTTLTIDQMERAAFMFNGALTANRTITIPTDYKGTFTIRNATSGGFRLTVTTGSGATAVVPNGVSMTVSTDGTNVYRASGAGRDELSVTGAKGSNEALASLITQLVALGLISDGTTA